MAKQPNPTINLDDTSTHAHRNPNDSVCCSFRSLTEHEYLIYRDLIPAEEDANTLDWDAYLTTLAARTGLSAYAIEKRLMAVYEVEHRLPTIKAIQMVDYPLTMDHLVKLTDHTRTLTNEQLLEVEPALAFIINANYPHEALPTPRNFGHLIQDTILTTLDLPQPTKHKERGLRFTHHGNGNITVTATLGALPGTVLEKQTHHLANTDNLPPVDALEQLIMDTNDHHIVVNTFQLTDHEGTPLGEIFLPGDGFIPQPDIHKWAQNIRDGKNITDVPNQVTQAYRFTTDQRLYTLLRDEICRVPGCATRGAKTDIDHTINHADGGPTSTKNATRLCRTHHNLKTAKLLSYITNQDGIARFELPGGGIATTIPQGLRRIKMRTLSNLNRSKQAKTQEDFKQRKRRQQQAQTIAREQKLCHKLQQHGLNLKI